jgi:predicted RNase H-like nuclease (RuvC/YqgF family)
MKAMSDDLVKRLYSRQFPNWPTMEEAAAELTRLREQCEAKDAEIKQWKSLAQQYQRERAELADKLNGTPCAEIRWRHEIDAKDAEIAEQMTSSRVNESRIASLSAENERLRKALENWQEWWALPWQDKRPDVGDLNYLKGQKALAAHVGEGEKDGLE